MKKILPILLFLIIGLSWFFVFVPKQVIAQTSEDELIVTDTNNKWFVDDEVTAIGKNASRSGLLLDWALKDYNWSSTPPGLGSPLLPFWVTMRNIVYAMLVAVVMVAAIVMLVTRGRNLTIRRFIPRFIIIVILVTLSFSIVQVLYEIVDVIQGFFIRPGGVPISQKDLLFVGWNYEPFIGLRLLGEQNYESAFTTLLFVKLTTFTYYVMLGILLVRKIFLWFFIIISPLFPLLLFFYPLRNTAKIWLGEFFRWLLYAPLFAIFLAGVVSLWKIGIPLSFNFGSVNQSSTIIFPTAVSILLGGPGQAVGQLNSLNIVDTYAQYIVALMMLWGVIVIPWILLQIFLDYLSDINVSNAPVLKQIAHVINKLPVTPPPSIPPPVPPPDRGGAGLARSIPLIKDFRIPTITNITKSSPVSTTVNVQTLTNLSIPKLTDIARFESDSISNSQSTRQEVERIRETLTRIANPSSIQTQKDRSEFKKIRETLQAQSLKGDKIAANFLEAAQNYTASIQNVTQNETTNISTVIHELKNPQAVINEKEKERVIDLKQQVEKETEKGNPLAETLISASQKETLSDSDVKKVEAKIDEAKKNGNPLAVLLADLLTRRKKALLETKSPALPKTNRIQQVSLDDYEAVKKMWTENYENLEVPGGESQDRKAWIQSDIKEISETIELLSSEDTQQVKAGMEKVSSILPFLLIGGFSQDEIVAYLKAKLEAGKSVLTQLEKQDASEDTKITVERKKEQAPKHLAQTAMIDNPLETEEKSSLDTTPVRSVPSGNPLVANEEIVRMANLPIPTFKNIAQYEKMQLVPEDKQNQDIRLMRETLNGIASPDSTEDQTKKQYYKDIRAQLVSEQKKGNSLANSLLTSAQVVSNKNLKKNITSYVTVGDFLTRLVQTHESQEFAPLVKQILFASETGNDFARQLERVILNPSILSDSLEKLNLVNEILQKEKESDPLSNKILKRSMSQTLPEASGKISLLVSIATVLQALTNKTYLPEGLQKEVENVQDYLAKTSDPTVKKFSDIVKDISEKGIDLRSILLVEQFISGYSGKDSPLATLFTSVSQKDEKNVPQIILPQKNAFQTVGIEDYEAVKRMWAEGYKTLDVPGGKSREEWLKAEVSTISETISYLSSQNSADQEEGARRVSHILPFLLIGGFSSTEVISYLKAKLEAANEILDQIMQSQEEEDTKPEVQKNQKSGPANSR